MCVCVRVCVCMCMHVHACLGGGRWWVLDELSGVSEADLSTLAVQPCQLSAVGKGVPAKSLSSFLSPAWCGSEYSPLYACNHHWATSPKTLVRKSPSRGVLLAQGPLSRHICPTSFQPPSSLHSFPPHSVVPAQPPPMPAAQFSWDREEGQSRWLNSSSHQGMVSRQPNMGDPRSE